MRWFTYWTCHKFILHFNLMFWQICSIKTKSFHSKIIYKKMNPVTTVIYFYFETTRGKKKFSISYSFNLDRKRMFCSNITTPNLQINQPRVAIFSLVWAKFSRVIHPYTLFVLKVIFPRCEMLYFY